MRFLQEMTKLIMFLAVLAGVSAWFSYHSANTITGNAKVIDGDSLFVDGKEVRLFGVDAPEYEQQCAEKSGNEETSYPCGVLAARYLKQLTASANVECKGQGTDKYDRFLAVCRAGTRELNREMVLKGWAVSFGDYEVEEATARKSAVGLWRGDFDQPSDWRRSKNEKHEQNWLNNLFSW